jgi:glycosyltransferase involved in cell wall biosynthesis
MREISERFAADGHRVTVATTDADAAEGFWNPAKSRLTQSAETHNGVRIRRFPLRHLPLAPISYSLWRYLIFPQLAKVLPVAWLLSLCRFTPWSPELWRWAETTTETYDLVGAMGILYEPFVVAAQRIAKRQQIPLVVYPLTHLGAGSAPARDTVSRYYTMRHQVALVRAAHHTLVMTPTEGAYYERCGVPRDRISVVGAGVNPAQVSGGNAERFREQHRLRGPIVAFLSAMAYDKGAMHLVEAVRQLWQQGCPVDLVMAGTLLDPFRRYLARLPSPDRGRVHVLASIAETEKRDLLAAMDILAMPSRTDSFGIIYLEAWLYEKPVIGARAWGMQDVIQDGENGILVPFGDVRALAQALTVLLEAPARRAAMGARGAAKVRSTYTWDHCYRQIQDVYADLVTPPV